MIKKVVLLLSIFLFLSQAQQVNAADQGDYTCRWVTHSQSCEVRLNRCTTGFKENCSQFIDEIECSHVGSQLQECIFDPNSLPPEITDCPLESCTTSADCGGAPCEGVGAEACSGTCNFTATCAPGKCNFTNDCEAATPCTNAVPGEWCSGNCSGVTEELGWACLPGQGCVEIAGGQYTDFHRCKAACPDDKPPRIVLQLFCASGPPNIDSAIGCIPLGSSSAFFKWMYTWGLGIAGGTAFLLLLIAGFEILTSEGNPKRLQAGKELIISALTGLLLLIFAVFMLRLIGVDILNILPI